MLELFRASLRCHDHASLGAAYTRKHISCIFLFRCQADIGAHMDRAAQYSCGTCTALPLAATIGNLHPVTLRHLEQTAACVKVACFLRVHEVNGTDRGTGTLFRRRSPLAKTLLGDTALLYT